MQAEIDFVPTGSVAAAINMDGAALPAEIRLAVTNVETDITITTDPLKVSKLDNNGWMAIELSQPWPFGKTYTVAVIGDGSSVYSSAEINNPAPGKRRSRVLRQRIYEVLYKAYDFEVLDIIPYGSAFSPASVAANWKAKAGIYIEVAPAFFEAIERESGNGQATMVSVPITGYATSDGPEDKESLVDVMEETLSYLIETDWQLQSFNVLQGEAQITAGEPEQDTDRQMITLRATLSVPMRRNF